MIKRWVEGLLGTPKRRLAARALLSGLVVFGQLEYVSDEPFSQATVAASLTAAAWAAAEAFTPLNSLVGWFRGTTNA